MPYDEDDMLMLSGIQHFAFCPRQWALIHIEQQWEENRLTTEGRIQHEHVDDPFYRAKVGDYVILRHLSIASKELGLYGITDAVELHPSTIAEDAIQHPRYPGYWKPFPIEYKHGHAKPDERDVVQLVAQAMCLEEQYNIQIPFGAIFYWETNRRETIHITDQKKEMTRQYAQEMHKIFATGIIPAAELKSHCRQCSLNNICLPNVQKQAKVETYLKKNLYAEIT